MISTKRYFDKSPSIKAIKCLQIKQRALSGINHNSVLENNKSGRAVYDICEKKTNNLKEFQKGYKITSRSAGVRGKSRTSRLWRS